MQGTYRLPCLLILHERSGPRSVQIMGFQIKERNELSHILPCSSRMCLQNTPYGTRVKLYPLKIKRGIPYVSWVLHIQRPLNCYGYIYTPGQTASYHYFIHQIASESLIRCFCHISLWPERELGNKATWLYRKSWNNDDDDDEEK